MMNVQTAFQIGTDNSYSSFVRWVQRFLVPLFALPLLAPIFLPRYSHFGTTAYFWEVSGFETIVVLFLLGFVWVMARWSRRAAEDGNQTAKQLGLLADMARVGTWQWDIKNDQMSLSGLCAEWVQRSSPAHIDFEEFLARVHPEDQASVREAVREALALGVYDAQFRVQLPDGSCRWIAASGLIDLDRNENPLRMTAVCMDVSEKRDAQETARKLSERLINAQEEERRRIARELHDDLNQRLALLSIEMDLLRQIPSSDGAAELKPRLARAALQIAELSSEVHKLSYQLHPAKLDQLGLVAAARSFCRELSQQSGIKIAFAESRTPRDLPPDVALCIYRLIQEALQNVVRHSGATSAQVELEFEGGDLKLSVTDSGAGFDCNLASRKSGLGLISMEERVRLVHGGLEIVSRPGRGTRITATVPILKNHSKLARTLPYPQHSEANKADHNL